MLLAFVAACGLSQTWRPIRISAATDYPVYFGNMDPRRDMLAMEANVGGHPVRVLLDTGAIDTYISPKLVQKARLSTEKAELRGETVQMSRFSLSFDVPTKGLPLRPYLSSPPIAGVVKELPYPDMDVHLGLDYLKAHAIGFDRITHRISIWGGGNVSEDVRRFWFSHAPYPDSSFIGWAAPGDDRWYQGTHYWNPVPKGAKPFEVRLAHDNEKEWDWFWAAISVNGIPTLAVLDTGTSDMMVDQTLAKRASIRTLAMALLPGWRSEIMHRIGVASTVAYGGLSFGPAQITIKPDEPEFDSILGWEAFENCKVLLDFPANKMYVWRVPGRMRSASIFAMYGLMNVSIPGGRDVLHVIPGGPAAKAGVEEGSSIEQNLRIDIPGVTDKSDANKVLLSFWKVAPKILKLKVKSPSGKVKTVSIRRSDAPPPVSN